MSELEFLPVNFEFEGSNYYALVRKKVEGNAINYYITVMNGDLESLLYGNHIIVEIDGVLQVDDVIEDRKQAELKLAITEALQAALPGPLPQA